MRQVWLLLLIRVALHDGAVIAEERRPGNSSTARADASAQQHAVAANRTVPRQAGDNEQGNQVNVQVFYKTDCPHCAEFIRKGVSELVDAQLPGDRVKISVVPMVKPSNGQQECGRDALCSSALPLLCAWRPLVPQPVAADNPLFPSTMKFLSCDLMFSKGGSGDAVKECARRAGLDFEALERCSAGEQVVDTIRTADFGGQIVGAIKRLQTAGFDDNIAMPWVFIDSEFLQCSGDGCTGTMHPDGAEPLEKPGSLLYLVCASLHPQPAACADVQGYGTTAIVSSLKHCENCVEIPEAKWQRLRQASSSNMAWFTPLAFVGLTAVVGRCGWVQWRRHRVSLGLEFMPLVMTDTDD